MYLQITYLQKNIAKILQIIKYCKCIYIHMYTRIHNSSAYKLFSTKNLYICNVNYRSKLTISKISKRDHH